MAFRPTLFLPYYEFARCVAYVGAPVLDYLSLTPGHDARRDELAGWIRARRIPAGAGCVRVGDDYRFPDGWTIRVATAEPVQLADNWGYGDPPQYVMEPIRPIELRME